MGKTTGLALGLIFLSLLLLPGVDSCFGDVAVKFSYSGLTGPHRWSSLCPEYKACSTGQAQSPINIVTSKLRWNNRLKCLDRKYMSEASATLVDLGVSVVVKFESDAGILMIAEKNYKLVQVHWHTPSEHTIDGVRYDAELHMVHKTASGALTVVAVLYKLGEQDRFIRHLEKRLEKLPMEISGSNQTQVPLGTVPIRSLRKYTHHSYYRYMGSLTVPPCSENVLWNIMAEVRDISREQLKLIRAPLNVNSINNFRPSQPINGRVVELYRKGS